MPFVSGRPTVDMRLRFEHVDQSDKVKDADAITIRARLGYLTGEFHGFARQHEQTFDAVLVSNTSLPATTLSYAYVARVNRMFGPDSPVGEYDSHSHLLNVVYAGLLPALRVESYAYLLDLEQAPTLSTATYGLRGEGSFQLGSRLTARVNGAFAHQMDRADNPLSISLSYHLLESATANSAPCSGGECSKAMEPSVSKRLFASPHGFQGWVEVFVTKPADGLTDLYTKAAYSLPPLTGIPLGASREAALSSWGIHDGASRADDIGGGPEQRTGGLCGFCLCQRRRLALLRSRPSRQLMWIAF
jgi:hypothetical protein